MLPYVFSGFPFVERFYSYGDIDSTNEKASTFSTLPERGIFVFQADRQTRGKGRYNRVFFSDTEGGLWISILLRIEELSNHFIYNRAITLAIVASVHKYIADAPLKIKWPNDIYWNDRKLCGILLETHSTQPQALVIGFGLNVNFQFSSFPLEIRTIATSIHHETGKQIPLSTLLRTIIEFFREYTQADQSFMHANYLSLLYRKGSRVKIDSTEGVLKSVAIDGRVLVVTPEETVYVNSGTMHFLDR